MGSSSFVDVSSKMRREPEGTEIFPYGLEKVPVSTPDGTIMDVAEGNATCDPSLDDRRVKRLRYL